MHDQASSNHLFILTVCLGASLSAACGGQTEDGSEGIRATAQHVRAGTSESGDTLLGMNVIVTDGEGEPVSCEDGDLEVSVTLHSDSGTTQLDPGQFSVGCAQSPTELALVVDNSGSEENHLELIAESAKRLTNSVIQAGGGASLVRVSTESRALLPLTTSTEEMNAALDDLFVNKGWTALYDGVRLANETLGYSHADQKTYSDSRDFCTTTPRRAIVVLTDGYENNSANQYANEFYPGDGIDTTLDDLKGLKVNGAGTSIYPLGMGEYVDHAGLQGLAEATGGRYQPVDSIDELPHVFDIVGEYVGPSLQVCGETHDGHCGSVTVEIDYKWSDGEREVRGTASRQIEVSCEPPTQAGRIATVLMTLTNPGIPAAGAKALANDTVEWVSPVPSPRVLVVRDDNHQSEIASDSQSIASWLRAAGRPVDFLEEPENGVTAAHLAGYDVVWFSNPGYPMDDQGSFMALQQFNGQGGGVVLQGDDMAWSYGNAFPMTPLTGLEYVDNGTQFCGHAIDNNEYDTRYRVQFEPGHPMVQSVSGATWLYGNDIDTSKPSGAGEQVLAWADLVQQSGKKVKTLCADKVPVIVVSDPR